MISSCWRFLSICVRRDGILDWIPCISGTVKFRLSFSTEYLTGSRRYVTDRRTTRDVSWLVIRCDRGMMYVRSMTWLCLRSLTRRWTSRRSRCIRRILVLECLTRILLTNPWGDKRLRASYRKIRLSYQWNKGTHRDWMTAGHRTIFLSSSVTVHSRRPLEMCRKITSPRFVHHSSCMCYLTLSL